MEDESSSFSGSSWFNRLFKKDSGILEQEITEDAYNDLKRLLMRANPETRGDKVILRLPKGEVVLSRTKLKVVAPNRREAEKILRNLHHYSLPPGLWPSYGLSYSIKRSAMKIRGG
ncbi:hypothetical protein PAP_02945 [Palaeococcus pacificus DY20341]|uniref:Uncharacterized protein n=1 Tax=Palaeococcus pacificus DY20341 TaxID=1343739 RepID=A0A075LRQ3_9EURY|nr:hypothetical protein [Palaeococcus pacificus]AIF69009.1 hypothetical protein PAP_02945 [Palaeococcus pacificus DY20341]